MSSEEAHLTRRAFAAMLLAPALSSAAGCRRPNRSRGCGSTDATPRDTPPATEERVTVDCGAELGPFARLSGVQGSPYPLVADDVDHRDRYRAHHIASVRFPQDCAPNTLTLAAIFADGSADPSRADSYDFKAIDKHVEAARSTGASILWQSSYDVGMTDSWKGLNLGGRAPEDMDRWRAVVTRCLEHFNNGWADGFDYAVRFVEFVNEPNGLGGFGGPKMGELIPAFLAFLRAIERYNIAQPATPVRAVGPGIPFAYPDWNEWRPRFAKLFAALRKASIALPVFSFHTYGDDTSPTANARLALALRKQLDEHDMHDTELWNTEWQGGGFLRPHLNVTRRHVLKATERERRMWSAGLATYALSCKLRWQGLVQGSYYYRANMRAFGELRPGPKPGHTLLGSSLHFSPKGAVRHLALQEKLTQRAQLVAPLRCETAWRDDGLLAACGLKSRGADRAAVLLCNLAKTKRKLSLQLRRPPRPTITSATAVLLSADDDGLTEHALPLDRPQAAKAELRVSLAPLSSQLLIVELG